MSNIRSEPYWSGNHSEEYLSELDVFVRKLYAENCYERKAHEKPYESFVDYVEQQAILFKLSLMKNVLIQPIY